jgi:hypothetical protein
VIKGRQAYKNLRHFIYIHAHPQSRGEGYRLVKKLLEETREDCAKAVEEIEDWADANDKKDECPHCDAMLYPWEICDCDKRKPAAALRGRG